MSFDINNYLSKRLLAPVLAAATLLAPLWASAEDIDLFVGRGTPSTDAANVLIILDNTANWGPDAKFQAQKEALVDAFANLPDGKVNVGLMMYTETGGDDNNVGGAYVRAAIRPLNTTTRAAYRRLLLGDESTTFGLDVSIDASNSGKAGLTMAEAFLYYQGGDGTWEVPWAGNGKAKTDYTNNYYLNHGNPSRATCCVDSHDVWNLIAPSGSSTEEAARYISALDSKDDRQYNSPVDPNACAENFILYIGNGPAQDSASDNSDARDILVNQSEVSEYITGIANGGGFAISPAGSRDNMADEWAYFMSNDSELNIVTFGVDVQIYPNANQCSNTSAAGWSALMENMSKGVGGGEYYKQCGDTFDVNQFSADLGDAFNKILSRNSVFASVALPAAATEQSTFLNQVFIGMFRPDARARPLWAGNLKQYKIGIDANDETLKVVDAEGAGLIDTSDTDNGGFIEGCARSYWTPTTDDSYWGYLDTDGDDTTKTEQNCAANPGASNTPDGYMVEKGGQAYTLRSMGLADRELLTCDPDLATCNGTGLEDFEPANTAITMADLDANDPTDRIELIAWGFGIDVDDEDGDDADNDWTTSPEWRPSVHADIVHAQPVAVDYAQDPNNPEVVVFYGGNDGMLRAINGNQTSSHGTRGPGEEFWAYMPPEFYPAIKRLRVNTDTIRFPASGPTAGEGSAGGLKDYGMDGPLSAYALDTDNDGDADERGLLAGVRRAGRLIYSFDVTSKTTPTLNWKIGCPNLDNDTGCTSYDTTADGDSISDWVALGQTWSRMSIFYAEGYDPGNDGDLDPMIIMGGGYDDCEDDDDGSTENNDCSTTKGNRIYVLDADDGDVLNWFATDRSVPGNVIVVPVSDDDPRAMFAYAADTGGNVYRISGDNGTGDPAIIGDTAPSTWIITKIASLGCDTTSSCSANRKFLFGPDVIRIPETDKFGVLLGSGDREKPLIDYSVTNGVQNYFYSLIDQPLNPSWLDDSSESPVPCSGAGVICHNWLTTVATGDTFDPDLAISDRGWKLPLRSGEQVVTGAITVDNDVNFSTHIPTQPQQCESDYGTATAYQVNYASASGSTSEFIGGGLVPTPVAGKVLIDGEAIPFCIGCGDEGSPIGAGKVGGGITWTQPRSRVWWNIDQVDD